MKEFGPNNENKKPKLIYKDTWIVYKPTDPGDFLIDDEIHKKELEEELG